MPLYEFVCGKCKKPFEELVSSSEASSPPCPACGAGGSERVLSVFAVGHAEGRSSARADALPAGCGSCGNPDGPGACRFNQAS
ncbi:MAG: zinc ribbon domain-containing protein [Polyangiaceae bacterium]|nr:zinc ribbon domain-containing protein [Polyangiaceae bacterium]